MKSILPIAAGAVALVACSVPTESRAEVNVSVQVTLAGAAVGGIAWALSIGWSNQLLPALSAPLYAAAEPFGASESDGEPHLLYVPLLFLSLP